MKPGWLLKTLTPSVSIWRNASLPSSESRSMFHLPMVQRTYATPPLRGSRSVSREQDNLSLEGGASSPNLLEEPASCEVRRYGVLRSCAIFAAFATISATALVGSGRGKGEVACPPKKT